MLNYLSDWPFCADMEGSCHYHAVAHSIKCFAQMTVQVLRMWLDSMLIGNTDRRIVGTKVTWENRETYQLCFASWYLVQLTALGHSAIHQWYEGSCPSVPVKRAPSTQGVVTCSLLTENGSPKLLPGHCVIMILIHLVSSGRPISDYTFGGRPGLVQSRNDLYCSESAQ